MSIPGIIITLVFIENFVLTQFFGLCPVMGDSRRLGTVIGMGFSTVFIMALANIATWLLYNLVLVPLHITFIKTLVFIVIITLLVQGIGLMIKTVTPALHKAIGVHLPVIAVNCAVLGMALFTVIREQYDLLTTVIAGLAGGAGFMLVIIIMSGIREKIGMENVPVLFRRIPIAFITAGLMAMAFMAFDKTLLINLHLAG